MRTKDATMFYVLKSISVIKIKKYFDIFLTFSLFKDLNITQVHKIALSNIRQCRLIIILILSGW